MGLFAPQTFVVQNITNPQVFISVFGVSIPPNNSLNVMQIPGVTIAAVESSLLNGELYQLIVSQSIIITATNIGLILIGPSGSSGQQGPQGQQGIPGPEGPQGPQGFSGPSSYVPPLEPAFGTNNTLVVDGRGVVSWQPLGGYLITSFSISESRIVEVGSSIPSINWSATFNFTPISITVTCTGQTPQTPTPSGTSSSGVFTPSIPFTSSNDGDTITLSITAIDSTGAPHMMNTNLVFSSVIVWGSISSPSIGQTLWNSLAIQNTLLTTSLNATLSFSSVAGQIQTFAVLSSLGTPTLKDSGGDVYPPTLLGTATIVENSTNQSINFYTVGVPGITFTWTMT